MKITGWCVICEDSKDVDEITFGRKPLPQPFTGKPTFEVRATLAITFSCKHEQTFSIRRGLTPDESRRL